MVPIVGRVFQERQQYDEAIQQFQIAQQLQPGDERCCSQAIIDCYECAGRIGQSHRGITQADRSPPAPQLDSYQQLAERLDDEAESDRAITSLVEAVPPKPTTIEALAEFRQNQDRWHEAVDEWMQVAQLHPAQPTGLIGLCMRSAFEDWEGLRKTLGTLKADQWPAEFASEVKEAETLRKQLPE